MSFSPSARFVFYDADLVFPFPSKYDSNRTYSLIFEAPMEALQKIVDEWLSNPTGGEMEFEPALPFVVMTAAFYDAAFICEKPFEEQGKYSYSEWICRIFVKQKKRLDCGGIFEPVYSMIPFIFVSQPAPMVSGRQVFGMPKVIGDIRINYPESFSLFADSVTAFDTENPQQYQGHQLIKINRIDQNPTQDDRGEEGALEQLVDVEAYLIKQLSEFAFGSQPLSSAEIIRAAGLLVNMHHKRFISLRQIRDFMDPDRALYKSLLQYVADNIQIRNVAPIFSGYELTFPEKTVSFPIADCLGLKDGQRAIGGYWMEWSFEIHPDGELWNARNPKSESRLSEWVDPVGMISRLMSQWGG